MTNPAELSPQELRILVAAADSGSFSAAAATLGTTQSGVSHAVRGIERKVGAVLFARGRTGARPTAAGTTAAAHARRVLRMLDVLVVDARAAARGTGTDEAADGPLQIAAFRSAALHLLPPVLARLAARRPGIEPRVRIVREVGSGTAGEVVAGRADVGIATLGTATPTPPGLVAGVLLEEPYALVHPAGHPEPRSLPLVDWTENCSSYTREWWAIQEWIPRATIEAEDDGAVLAMVAGGHGMAIMPALSLAAAPSTVRITDLGPGRPTRSVGYVTTPELAASAAVRALVRELRLAHMGAVAPPTWHIGDAPEAVPRG
ncbi:LysR family transcriptional regulator [Embleya sp. NPDC020630]|uniref:LysR family transcriptional regulator n=1 Tax=Embleya sp. NPDC020630 TaxID=3363979 RepID=UPI0037A78908